MTGHQSRSFRSDLAGSTQGPTAGLAPARPVHRPTADPVLEHPVLPRTAVRALVRHALRPVAAPALQRPAPLVPQVLALRALIARARPPTAAPGMARSFAQRRRCHARRDNRFPPRAASLEDMTGSPNSACPKDRTSSRR